MIVTCCVAWIVGAAMLVGGAVVGSWWPARVGVVLMVLAFAGLVGEVL